VFQANSETRAAPFRRAPIFHSASGAAVSTAAWPPAKKKLSSLVGLDFFLFFERVYGRRFNLRSSSSKGSSPRARATSRTDPPVHNRAFRLEPAHSFVGQIITARCESPSISRHSRLDRSLPSIDTAWAKPPPRRQSRAAQHDRRPTPQTIEVSRFPRENDFPNQFIRHLFNAAGPRFGRILQYPLQHAPCAPRINRGLI